MNAVFLQRGVEGAGEGGVEDCGGKGKADDEEAADCADNRGGDAAKAGEEREEADEDFGDRADQSNDVGDEHPLGHGFIGGKACAELFAEELVDARVVEAPDGDGIEPEFVRVRGAVGDAFAYAACTIGTEVPVAVIPQVDMVEVFDVQCCFHCSSSNVAKLVCDVV